MVGERPYRCTFEGCDYAAADGGKVKKHMFKHSGLPMEATVPDAVVRKSTKKGKKDEEDMSLVLPSVPETTTAPNDVADAETGPAGELWSI